MKQPVSLPSETTFIKRTRETDSPLQRMAPGYENYEALSVLFSAAFNRALEELDGYREGDDLQPLLVCLAEHCFRAGIPEEDTVVDKGALPAPFGRVTDSRNCEKCLPFRQGIRQEEQSDGRTAFRHADGRIYEAPL